MPQQKPYHIIIEFISHMLLCIWVLSDGTEPHDIQLPYGNICTQCIPYFKPYTSHADIYSMHWCHY